MAHHAPFGPESHLYLIDASGFIFRAYHALPPLTRKSDGIPVGAVSGFCNMLFKLVEDAGGAGGATHLIAVFDKSGDTFRNAIYPEYKAHRPAPPEDLRPQFPLVRDATRAFGLPCVEAEGWEADDIIAAYCKAAAPAKVTVVSSDKDLMQLVSDRVRLYDGMKNRIIGHDEVVEKFGVGPDRVVDVQSLAGDSVDNVPGAPGIGIKTAAQLIAEYGDLDSLLARAAEIKQPKRRQTLIDNAEQIRISRRLVTLADDAPTPCPLDEAGLGAADPAALIGFLRAMEFRSLTQRAAQRLGVEVEDYAATPAQSAQPAEAPAATVATPSAPAAPIPFDHGAYEIVRDLPALHVWIDAARAQGHVAIDTETTSLDEMRAELVGVSLALGPGKACYVPLGHVTGDGDLLGAAERAEGQIPLQAAIEALRPLLADDSVLKIGQNLKYDIKVLANYGLTVSPIDDTMLMSYAQDSGLHGHGMDALSQEFLGHTPIPIKDLLGTGKKQITFDKVPLEQAARYAAEDADVTYRLWARLRPRLIERRAATVYETLERPLIPVLAAMERRGIKVDRDALSRMSNSFAQRMAAFEDEIHALADGPFNVASPKQLGEILFDRMGLPGGTRTKTGAWATGADVLETLAAEGSELAGRVLDWRQLAKLKSTYTDALQDHINPDTGRVHTSFSLAATTTGRLASTDPNLQNIPVRSEEGREIRKAFIAEPGNVLISLDYSQIELRILAHVAGLDAMRDAFARGEDIHAATASAMFGVPVEGMDPMIRRRAKAINFGVIYGISAHGLSANLRIPRAEAATFINAYFDRFPGIKDYMERTKAQARAHGYVETIFGRRVHTPGIDAKGPARGYAERAAINAPIQGAAADVIRRAMIRIPAALAAAGLRAQMLLQVHDELIFEAPEAEADETIAVVRRVMERAPEPAAHLTTPMVAEAGVGASWAEAH